MGRSVTGMFKVPSCLAGRVWVESGETICEMTDGFEFVSLKRSGANGGSQLDPTENIAGECGDPSIEPGALADYLSLERLRIHSSCCDCC